MALVSASCSALPTRALYTCSTESKVCRVNFDAVYFDTNLFIFAPPNISSVWLIFTTLSWDIYLFIAVFGELG